MAKDVAGLPVEEETPPLGGFYHQTSWEDETGAPLLFQQRVYELSSLCPAVWCSATISIPIC